MKLLIVLSPNVSLILGASNPDGLVYTNIGVDEEFIFINNNGYVTGQSNKISSMTREQVHYALYGTNDDHIEPAEDSILYGINDGIYPVTDFESTYFSVLPGEVLCIITERLLSTEIFNSRPFWHALDEMIGVEGGEGTYFIGTLSEFLDKVAEYSELYAPEGGVYKRIDLSRVSNSPIIGDNSFYINEEVVPTYLFICPIEENIHEGYYVDDPEPHYPCMCLLEPAESAFPDVIEAFDSYSFFGWYEQGYGYEVYGLRERLADPIPTGSEVIIPDEVAEP